MKKPALSSLLALGIILHGGISEGGGFILPERFEGHRASSVAKTDIVRVCSDLFIANYYDLEGDGVNDVVELFPLLNLRGEVL